MNTKIDRQMMIDERAELEALLHAKESLASRIGLVPFLAGALTAFAFFLLANHV